MSYSEAPSQALVLQLHDKSWDIEVQMFGLIADLLQARSHYTVAQVAGSIDALFPTRRPSTETKKEEPESFLLEFWGLIFRIAGQIPPKHPAIDTLVALVAELQKLDEEGLQIWGHHIKLWSDLPLFGPQLTETRQSMARKDWEESSLRELVSKLQETHVINTWAI